MMGNDESLSGSEIPWDAWLSDAPEPDHEPAYLRFGFSHEELVDYALGLQDSRRVTREVVSMALAHVVHLTARLKTSAAQVDRLRKELQIAGAEVRAARRAA